MLHNVIIYQAEPSCWMISRFIGIRWEKTYHPAVVLLGRVCCWVQKGGWVIIRHDELHFFTFFTCSYWDCDVWYLCCCDTVIGKVVDPCRQVWIAPSFTPRLGWLYGNHNNGRGLQKLTGKRPGYSTRYHPNMTTSISSKLEQGFS